MNKSLLTLLFASMLILQSLTCLAYVKADLVDENGGLIAKAPYIVFPTNTTYNISPQFLNVSFHAPIAGNINYFMNYSLDDSVNKSVPLTIHYFGFQLQNESYLDGTVNLPAMTSGSHKISVYLEFYLSSNISDSPNGPSHVVSNTAYDSQTLYFTVGDSNGISQAVPELSWLVIVPLLLSMLLVAVIVRHRKTANVKQ